MASWLMKSELDVYPWSKLVEDGKTHWDGVRNYQVLYYHSNCKPPHVAGVAEVVREGYPDHTSWDSNSKYRDEKSTPESPRWFMVDIAPVAEMKAVSLDELRQNGDLEGMALLARGQRLSVQPVEEEHFRIVCQMGGIDSTSIGR